MEKEKLKALFEKKGAKQADFVAWALSKGVSVNSSEISRHVTKGGISRWAELAYLAFFKEFKPNGYLIPEPFMDGIIDAMKKHSKAIDEDTLRRLKALEDRIGE